MENQKVMQFVEDIVKEEIRKGNVVKNRDVLSMLPEVIDALHINKKEIRSSIEQCPGSLLKNALNVIGIQVIKKDTVLEMAESHAERWITLNPREFKAIVQRISQKLYELESQANQKYDEEKKSRDELFDKYEELERKYNQLKRDAEINEKLIAERIQYILSLKGKDAVSDSEQLIELLKDLSIDVYWDCSNVPLTDGEMFTEYVIEDEALVGTKPCLVRNGIVYVKGLRLIKK